VIVRNSLSWGKIAGYVGRPIGLHVLLASAVVVAHDYAGAAWLSVPALPITVLAAAIGILLGFRNNSGYDRWWEARTLWGGVVNQSRTFARQVLTFLPARTAGDGNGDGRDDGADPISTSRLLRTAAPPDAGGRIVGTDGAVRDRLGTARAVERAPGAATGVAGVRPAAARATAPEPCHFQHVSDDARELVYAQIGFVNAMRCHLRRQDPLPEIAPFLRPPVVEALHGEQNVPAAILVWMATRLRRTFGRDPGAEGAFRLVALDETLTELTNLLGGCERIKNTPIPRQYDWLPRVITRAYLALLPLGVVAELGLATPFVTAVIAFLFLSMDTIGRNVEAPFENGIHDTPMTALCRTIEINLRQMLGETELPPPVQPVDGFLY